MINQLNEMLKKGCAPLSNDILLEFTTQESLAKMILARNGKSGLKKVVESVVNPIAFAVKPLVSFLNNNKPSSNTNKKNEVPRTPEKKMSSVKKVKSPMKGHLLDESDLAEKRFGHAFKLPRTLSLNDGLEANRCHFKYNL